MFNKSRLSDGFKGIINKINSNSSPTKEASGETSTDEQTTKRQLSSDDEALLIDDDEREGFLCPQCLSAFPSADDLQSHYSIHHASQINSQQSVLCSVCKMRFGSQQECEGHFLRHHTKNEEPDPAKSSPIVVDNSELKEELRRIEALLAPGAMATDKLEFYQNQTQALFESKVLMMSEIESLRKQLEQEKQLQEELKADFNEEKVRWNAERERLAIENDRLAKEALAQVTASDSNQAAIERYTSEIARIEQRNKDLSGQLEQLRLDSQKKIEELGKQNTDIKRRLEHSESLLKKVEQDQEAAEKSTSLEVQDLADKHNDTIQKLKQEFDEKEKKWEQQLQISAQSEATVENERRSLEHIVQLLRDESSAKDALREEAERKHKQQLKDAEKAIAAKISELEKASTSKIKELEAELNKKSMQVQAYENEKISLEKQMEVINRELRKVEEGLELKIIESNKQAATLRDLEAKLSGMQDEFKAKATNYDTEITSLKEQALLWENKAEQEKTVSSALLVEKLELEAKLSLSQDDLAQHIEQTRKKEHDFEQGKKELHDLRRKYDDTLAALLDLGRENQALQIEQAKLMGRKWADDNQCTECTNCSKQFTLTIRKHHCRNCGQIFCNECSMKQAIFASYKNKVRVCDPCFLEVNQGNTQE